MILSFQERLNIETINSSMMTDLLMHFILFDNYAAKVYQTFVCETISLHVFAVRGEIRSDQHCLEVYAVD